MHPDIIVSIDYSRILANAINLSESQLPALLRGTSLTPKTFLESEDYLSWDDQHRIITNALGIFNQDGLGVVAGGFFPLGTHGPLGMAAMSCPTLYESLETISRLHSTRAQFSSITLSKSEKYLVISDTLQVEHDEVGQFLVEALAVSMKLSLDILLGNTPEGTEFHFNFEKPSYSDLLESVLDAPVKYGQPITCEFIPIEWANKPIASRNEATRLFAEKQCETQFHSFRNRLSFNERVTTILRRAPNIALTQEDVASTLNVSSRTLLRKLREEGTTYQNILDTERKKVANHYLRHTDLSIETVAACMGYHDVSSFRRAFKRWFGYPPSEHV